MDRVPHAQSILIVDDETPWLRSLSLLIERALGLPAVRTCQDSRQAMALLAEEPADLVLLDVTMPFLSGEALLKEIRQTYPELPVIMLSGRNQVDIAVSCMKHGAFDYFVKTVDEQRLLTGIRHALELTSLQSENAHLRQSLLSGKLRHPEAFAEIVTRSPVMQSVFRYLEALAASAEPVLITGESGVGKELAARAVHRLSTPRGPWVAVNVAGLDDQVFSDTLFGHVRGAFTDAREDRAGMLQQAQDGVLFLDEIGDLSPTSQVKLLRLVQEREYTPLGSDRPSRTSARFVFATNQDLEARLADGRFRKDLFYRLGTHRVHLPPLRERREDLDLLVDHFLAEAATALGKRKPTVPPQLTGLLQSYPFPGNLRELRAMVYDAVTRHRHGVLSTRSFQEAMAATRERRSTAPTARQPHSGRGLAFGETLPTLKEVADLLVDEALRRTGNNQTQAARLLGVTRAALGKRLKNRARK